MKKLQNYLKEHLVSINISDLCTQKQYLIQIQKIPILFLKYIYINNLKSPKNITKV